MQLFWTFYLMFSKINNPSLGSEMVGRVKELKESWTTPIKVFLECEKNIP